MASTELRAAAQQALAALGLWATGRDMDAVSLNDLIFRLEGALAQPQRDPVDEYRKGFIAGQIDMRDREQAEPVQEPLGYLWPTGRHPEFRYTQQKIDGVDGTPVYTTPPQRKPLTEEEIEVLEAKYAPPVHPDFAETDDWFAFARAIERAHGIGGQQ